ncbi:MAG: YggT family protein [Gammaproteobacteria bacterium]|nr:YggT family protein [Gammaproteobacteria bacterium]
MGYFGNAGAFLIQTLFGLYLLVIMLRILLQWARADFYNPLSQFIVKVTNPPIIPLRRFIPSMRGIDTASVFLLLILKIMELLLLGLLPGQPLPAIPGLFLFAIVDLLALLVNVFLFSIFIQAILSWVGGANYNPIGALLNQLTAPVLRPFRNMIPPVSGMDLSPMAAMVAIYLVILLVIHPLKDWVGGLTYGIRPTMGF